MKIVIERTVTYKYTHEVDELDADTWGMYAHGNEIYQLNLENIRLELRFGDDVDILKISSRVYEPDPDRSPYDNSSQ